MGTFSLTQDDMTIYGDSFISHFSISLDNPAAVYLAGHEVVGCVHLHVEQPIECRGLFIQIKGDCNVHWTEKNTGYKVEPRHFRNYQQCFCWTHFFMGNPRSMITISPGAHEFEFQYRLPRKIPSSFEGTHGNVRYFCMAQLDWPGGNHFLQRLQCITVNSLLNLNRNPDTRSAEDEKTEYIQPLLRSSLKTTLSVLRRGFVPGQTVTAHATVDNKTMRSVLRARSELVEICTYKACDQEVQTKRVVATHKHGPIARGVKDTWFVSLDIPPIPPSGLVYCDIIHLDYFIKLSVESSRIPKQKVQIPLIIGTVPLVDDLDEFCTNMEDLEETTMVSGVPSQRKTQQKTPSIKFAESVWGKTELSTNQRRVSQAGVSFTPAYVCYRSRNSLVNNSTLTVKRGRAVTDTTEVMLEESEQDT